MNRKLISICLVVMLCSGFFLADFGQSATEHDKKAIIAINQEPSTMEPTLTFAGMDLVVIENYGEYLIQRVPSGELKPGLAASWKMSPDGKELAFELRKGVKFHSGDSLTVKDVQFSFERGRAKNSTTKTRMALVDKFEIIDDYHFKLHFKSPDVTFIPTRAAGVMIVSKSYYDRVGEDQFVKQPVGTGPYKFKYYLPGEYVDIERFDGYWGPKPSVKEARFYFIPEDTTRLAKLQTGEVDLIQGIPYPSIKDVEKNPQLKVMRLATNHPTQAVIFNVQNPKTPWHDRRVRLAMAYAIDCDAIIKNVAHGVPSRWAYLAPGEVGYDPNLKPYPYDPKKARELLTQAGYPQGFELKLYWWISGRHPMSREVTEAIAAYFEAVGIKTKLIGEEMAAGYARRKASKGPDAEFVLSAASTRAGGADPSYYMDLSYTTAGGMSVYSNPELDKLVAQAKGVADDAKRAELIKKAARISSEDVAAIPIFSQVNLYGMRKNVDFTPTQKNAQDLVLVKDITVK